MRRYLTNDRDVLPALSGIASEFQRTRKPGRYLAGLWDNDLLRGLLWWTAKPGSRSSSDGAYLSSPPSWSWASVKGCGINWTEEAEDPKSLAKIIHASCIPSTADDKGMVSGGQLTLSGKLNPLTVQYRTFGYSEDQWDSCEIVTTVNVCKLLVKHSERYSRPSRFRMDGANSIRMFHSALQAEG